MGKRQGLFLRDLEDHLKLWFLVVVDQDFLTAVNALNAALDRTSKDDRSLDLHLVLSATVAYCRPFKPCILPCGKREHTVRLPLDYAPGDAGADPDQVAKFHTDLLAVRDSYAAHSDLHRKSVHFQVRDSVAVPGEMAFSGGVAYEELSEGDQRKLLRNAMNGIREIRSEILSLAEALGYRAAALRTGGRIEIPPGLCPICSSHADR